MRFSVLATDYDNTLATNGAVSAEAWEALTRLRRSGRELVLVTGRELDDLLAICAHPELFSRIVAENGGLLYRPDTGELRTLAPPPPAAFAEALRARGVLHLGVGKTLIATMHPYEVGASKRQRLRPSPLREPWCSGARAARIVMPPCRSSRRAHVIRIDAMCANTHKAC